MKRFSRTFVRAVLSAGGLSLALVACGSDPKADDGLQSGGDDSSGDDFASGPVNAGSGGQLDGIGADGECRAIGLTEGCSGTVFEGEEAALDLLLMFDESGSMSTKVDAGTGETRQDIVQSALEAFLSDPETAGIGIGLGFFGQMPLGETSCDSESYEKLAVPFGLLPDHADQVTTALKAQEPTGETPTGAAIRAACTLALAHRDTEHAPTSILLVTDGEPKAPLSAPACEPTLEDAIDAAKTCFEDSGLLTYVLGVGPSLTSLNLIAEAGGTGSAYLAALDNRDEVLGALQRIRNSATLPCGFGVAADSGQKELDYQSTTVAYVDASCNYSGISRVETLSDCEAGSPGYFFDDPDAPTRIDLCPDTCTELRTKGQRLFYSIGCPLDVGIIK